MARKAANTQKNSHRADHLISYRWVKGQPSPNPTGRPRNAVQEASREWLEQVDPKTGLTHAQLAAAVQGTRALEGDTAAFTALADRAEGKPRQITDTTAHVELSTTDRAIADLTDAEIEKRRNAFLRSQGLKVVPINGQETTAIVVAESEES